MKFRDYLMENAELMTLNFSTSPVMQSHSISLMGDECDTDDDNGDSEQEENRETFEFVGDDDTNKKEKQDDGNCEDDEDEDGDEDEDAPGLRKMDADELLNLLSTNSAMGN